MAKTLDYNFAVDKSLVADTGPTLTCTRVSDATYYDASGVMQTAADNVARFDHDPSDSNASLGLLIEEARTNLIPDSNQIVGTKAWDDTYATLTGNSIASPDGATTASLMAAKIATDIHTIFPTVKTATPNDTYHTESLYVKDNGARYCSLGIHATTDRWAVTTFDLTAGTTNEQTGANSGTILDSGIVDAGGGWYRIWMVAKLTSIGAEEYYMVIAINSTGTPTLSGLGYETFLGEAGDKIYVWGASREAGSFATSLIPTEAASVTRAADVVETSDVSWANAAAGTFYDASTPAQLGTATAFRWSLSDNSNSNRVTAWQGSAGEGGTRMSNSTGSYNIVVGGVYVADTETRFACGYAVDDLVGYYDGVAGTPVTDTGSAVPSGLSVFHVGTDRTDLNQFNGHIARIAYWDSRLTDTQLEDMSNGTFPSEGLVGTFTEDEWFHRRRYLRRVRDNRLRYLRRR